MIKNIPSHILISLAFMIALFSNPAGLNGQLDKKHDVAAIVWPSYHPDARAKICWPDGIGEWQTVMSNKPKFEGHQQPRYPTWGYINEADPYVSAMEIEAATDHGINVFIFDWYWYDGMIYLEGHLNDGFLKAKNNGKMKFYLMWANHDVTRGWDKIGADDVFTGKDRTLICRGGVDRDYNEVVKDVEGMWYWIADHYTADYYPQVSVGWDAGPRAYRFTGGIIKNNTPENFETALRKAKAYVDAHPGQAPLITLNSWNEWTETSYLMPCTMYGYGYMEALKRVFC